MIYIDALDGANMRFNRTWRSEEICQFNLQLWRVDEV